MRRIVQYDVVTGNEPLPIPWRCDVCLRMVQLECLQSDSTSWSKVSMTHADDASEICELPHPGEILPGSERCG